VGAAARALLSCAARCSVLLLLLLLFRMRLGLEGRDLRAWLWVSAWLGCHLLYTRSSGAAPFWSHARVEAEASAAAALSPGRPPPLLLVGGEWLDDHCPNPASVAPPPMHGFACPHLAVSPLPTPLLTHPPSSPLNKNAHRTSLADADRIRRQPPGGAAAAHVQCGAARARALPRRRLSGQGRRRRAAGHHLLVAPRRPDGVFGSGWNRSLGGTSDRR